ncbi:hypothetical protein [Lentzea sp. E54]|uniref:hypothetical protein n=1 Tax=Lentzea xerophila TaxID=3435883 RepID=UPI003DA4E4AA
MRTEVTFVDSRLNVQAEDITKMLLNELLGTIGLALTPATSARCSSTVNRAKGTGEVLGVDLPALRAECAPHVITC